MTNTTKFTFIVTRYQGKAFLEDTMYPTTKEAIDDIATGQVDAHTIEKVVEIDLEIGTSRDVTRFVAIEVWRILDSNNDYAWRDMRNWLESFDLDCKHLNGETGDLARDFYGR